MINAIYDLGQKGLKPTSDTAKVCQDRPAEMRIDETKQPMSAVWTNLPQSGAQFGST